MVSKWFRGLKTDDSIVKGKFFAHIARAFVGTGYLKSPIPCPSLLPPAVVRPANVLSCPKFTLAVMPALLNADLIRTPTPLCPPFPSVKKLSPSSIAPPEV